MSAYAEPFSDEVIFSKRHTRVIKTIARSIFPSAADPFGNYRFGERGGMTRSRACADGETERVMRRGVRGNRVNFRRFISPGEIERITNPCHHMPFRI